MREHLRKILTERQHRGRAHPLEQTNMADSVQSTTSAVHPIRSSHPLLAQGGSSQHPAAKGFVPVGYQPHAPGHRLMGARLFVGQSCWRHDVGLIPSDCPGSPYPIRTVERHELSEGRLRGLTP